MFATLSDEDAAIALYPSYRPIHLPNTVAHFHPCRGALPPHLNKIVKAYKRETYGSLKPDSAADGHPGSRERSQLFPKRRSEQVHRRRPLPLSSMVVSAIPSRIMGQSFRDRVTI